MTALRDSLQINGMRVPNRLVFPPITSNYATAEGEVTDAMLGFYRQRSRGIGLVIVEAVAVRPDGRITPYSLGLWRDEQIEGMARLVRAIKAEGARAVAQISHAGARCTPNQGALAGASPSGVALRADVAPLVLDERQMATIRADFAAAARRALAAGFDGVEVHGAHFYLLSQFLSPLTNKRTDRYGGDAAGRAIFPAEVVQAVREAVGPSIPVLARLNAVEGGEGGQRLDDAVVAAQRLVAAGVDALDVSAIPEARWVENGGARLLQTSRAALPKEQAGGANVPYAATIRGATGVPVIAVGKIWTSALANAALAEGAADLIAIGRQMIADPASAMKILSGREEEIIPCNECMGCFVSVALKVGPLKCTVNLNPTGEPRYAAKQAAAK